MYHTEEYCTRLVVANLYHRLDLVLEGFGAIRIALHKVASVLIYYKEVVILV